MNLKSVLPSIYKLILGKLKMPLQCLVETLPWRAFVSCQEHKSFKGCEDYNGLKGCERDKLPNPHIIQTFAVNPTIFNTLFSLVVVNWSESPRSFASPMWDMFLAYSAVWKNGMCR